MLLGELAAWPQVTQAAFAQFDISVETTTPTDVTYDGSHFYVVDFGDTKVYEYDGSGNYVGEFIDLSLDGVTDAVSIAYNPTADLFYILSADAVIYVYNGVGTYVDEYDISGTVTSTTYIAWDDDAGTILVLNINSDIVEFNDDGTATGTSFDVSSTVSNATGLGVGGGYILVTNDTAWNVQKFDRSTGAVGSTIDISTDGAGNPTGLEYLYVGGVDYLTLIDSGFIYIFSADPSSPYTVDDDTYVGGSTWLSATNPELLAQGISSGTPFFIALRFAGATIAQGATITSATLRLFSYGSGATGTFGSLYGSDVDNAPAWSGAVTPNTITQTTASTSFVVTDTTAGTAQDFDVTDIVQEIVNRPGWQSGNALAFGGDTTGSDAAYNLFWSSEGSTAAYTSDVYEPKLIIVTSGGGGGDPPARELRLQGGVRLMNGVRLY